MYEVVSGGKYHWIEVTDGELWGLQGHSVFHKDPKFQSKKQGVVLN